MSKRKSGNSGKNAKIKSQRSQRSKPLAKLIDKMVIRRIPIKLINLAPYNPRVVMQPGDGEWEKLKRSLLEFDLVEPLVWNKRSGNLVGGHQRFRILTADTNDFKLTGNRVECSVVDLPPGKEKTLNILLNKVGGRFDPDMLAAHFAELKLDELEDEMTLTGFELQEIDEMINEFVDSEMNLMELENPQDAKVSDVELADRGANVSIQLGPDVIAQIDIEKTKSGSSRAGVARTIVEDWAKRRIKSGKKKKTKRKKG